MYRTGGRERGRGERNSRGVRDSDTYRRQSKQCIARGRLNYMALRCGDSFSLSPSPSIYLILYSLSLSLSLSIVLFLLPGLYFSTAALKYIARQEYVSRATTKERKKKDERKSYTYMHVLSLFLFLLLCTDFPACFCHARLELPSITLLISRECTSEREKERERKVLETDFCVRNDGPAESLALS